MYCPNCGEELQEVNQKFCQKCGAEIPSGQDVPQITAGSPLSAAAPVYHSIPTYRPTPRYQSTSVHTYRPPSYQKPQKSRQPFPWC